MKRLFAVLLALSAMLGLLCVGVQADHDNLSDYTQIQPIVRVRVNGSWYGADLTPYKGQDNVWVEIPIDPSKLKSHAENAFSLSTNVNSTGNRTDDSVDLYSTLQTESWGSFLCTDRWCDNNYTEYHDRRINLQVQVWENGAWTTIAGDEAYQTGESTVLGQFQGGGWYNAARNITLGDVSACTKARVLVNLHVGRDIQPLTDFPLNQLAQFYSYAPVLRVRVNGSWYGVGLEDAKGQDDTWVYCPVPISSLKTGESNAIQLSTNVKSAADFADSSVDLYATRTEGASDSFLTNHQYCDEGWSAYGDRSVNVRIELYDGRRWIAVPSAEAYSADEHCVLGLFTGNSTWYNAARNILVDGIDLSAYSAARVAVNLHVGTNLQTDGFLLENMATFLEPVQETPIAYYTVTATAGSGGSVSGAPQGPVEEGTSVTLVAQADDTHTFSGWYLQDALVSDQAQYTFAVTADVALEARFTEKDIPVCTVSAVVAEGGRVTGTGIVQVGTEVTLTAVPEEGYRFDGWYSGEDKVGSETTYVFTATQDVSLTARFVKKTYTLTVTAGDGGTVSGAPEDKVEHGIAVSLTAVAAEGYRFDGWYSGEDKVGSDPAYTLTVTGDTALTARFTLIPQDDGHRTEPEKPSAAQSDKDSASAAVRVRINGSWYGAYLEEYKGMDSVWVPVYVDITKLKAGEENYFHFSSNVISHGNFTDSSVDLYSTFADENLNSFLTSHPYCDENWVSYTDRNINVRLELYNGKSWVTVLPEEETFFDEHTVLGQFADDGSWYNAARNLVLGDLSGYSDARMMVQLHVGDTLEVADTYKPEEFATFLETPDYGGNPATGTKTAVMTAVLFAVTAVCTVWLTVRKSRRHCRAGR